MLKTISWSEYFTIVAVLYGLYFGWWLLKYYPGLKGIKAPGLGPKRSGIAESKEPCNAGSEKSANEGPGEDAPVSQPEGAGDVPYPLPVPVMAHLMEQQQVMTKLSIEVVKIAQTAVTEQWPVDKLAEPFRELFLKEPYCRLRGTHFQVKVDQRIVEELTKGGSISIDAEGVSNWWN